MSAIPPSQDTRAESLANAPLIERVRHFVLYGGHPVEASLSELALSQRFSVSRTPIREVLKQLENEGLVEVRPKVGTFIKVPTRSEIVDLFQLKESMEGLGASLMARSPSKSALDTLKRNVDASRRIVSTNEASVYANLVHEFHWTIILDSGNSKLVDHYSRLMNQLAYQSIVVETVSNPGRLSTSINEHQSVLEAIEAKDSIEAELAMRNHVHASSNAALMMPGLVERMRRNGS
ncbi:GntR family transcriptional regulator [Micrococcoides hystricis]|uniref:GntR family transcriptional regulator n=1 Tax=Micrococcoides hystricis TaxID=1572761 RepID=A0ABV6PBL9_9MICC